MSGDDQRTAEDAQLVEEALHCAETGNAGHWPTAAGFLADEVYRLRAELAETRAAGDGVADEVTSMLTGPVPDSGDWWPRLAPLIDRWRSVRGDAPTQPPAGRGPCRDCPPPGQFEILCGFCGEEVPTLAQVEDGLVEWPTDDEQLRDGQARVRLGEHGIEIVPDRAAPAVARTDGQPPADDTAPRRFVCDQDPHPAEVPCQSCEADGLTAEQYRHLYADLIRGLAVDLGLDPDKAGGGAVTAAVRRLVAGVSVPQKSTESPGDSLLDAGFAVASVLDTALADLPMPAEMEQDAIRVLTAWRVAADRPAAAGDTAAPDVQVWQSDDGDWGWACARCDYQSVPWWSDRDVAERAAVEHGRDHCPAGGSAPASTDGDQ